MKRCTYCGKEYADDTEQCAVDAQELEVIGSPNPPEPSILKILSGSAPADPALSVAQKQMRQGAFWCIGGLLVTFITFSMASGPSGGPYVVTWGAIIYGAAQFIRGFMARGR